MVVIGQWKHAGILPPGLHHSRFNVPCARQALTPVTRETETAPGTLFTVRRSTDLYDVTQELNMFLIARTNGKERGTVVLVALVAAHVVYTFFWSFMGSLLY